MADCDQTALVDLVLEMRRRDRRFRAVCRQLVLMNNDIRSTRCRFDRAMKKQQRSFRYPLRLRLGTLEGVRNMFTTYAHREADKLDALEDQLKAEHDIEWEDVSGDL